MWKKTGTNPYQILCIKIAKERQKIEGLLGFVILVKQLEK